MRSIGAGLAGLILIIAGCTTAPLAPPGNVDGGEQARAQAVEDHQCSVPESDQCECERAAIASGFGVETARAACTP